MSIFKSVVNKFKPSKNSGEHSPQKKQNIPKEKVIPPCTKLVAEIDRMIDDEEIYRLSKQEGPNMITYYDGKRKIININKKSDPPRTYFLFSGANHKAKELAAAGLRPVSKNEAKQKRYGPVKAMYTGHDAQIISSMLAKDK